MPRLLAILFILLSPVGAEAADDFVLATQGPSLEGKWAFRSFTISSEGSDNWADAAETVDSVEFSEAGDGSLTGTMVLHGNTFPIAGHVSYGNDRVLVTWSGEHPKKTSPSAASSTPTSCRCSLTPTSRSTCSRAPKA